MMPLSCRRWVALAALSLLAGTAIAQQPDPEVTPKVVNYDQLGEVLRQLRGKVVAVDFWADT